MIVYNSQLLYS